MQCLRSSRNGKHRPKVVCLACPWKKPRRRKSRPVRAHRTRGFTQSTAGSLGALAFSPDGQWLAGPLRWPIVNIVAIAQKKYTNSVGLLVVIPLALQFSTGLYLFVLPYAAKCRSRQSTDRRHMASPRKNHQLIRIPGVVNRTPVPITILFSFPMRRFCRVFRLFVQDRVGC